MYLSDMMKIFDNDYLTLTPFWRSFEYFFHTGFWPLIFFGLHPLPPPPHTHTHFDPATQLPAYILNGHYGIKDLLGQGGTYFYFKNREASPHISISYRMYRCIDLCLNEAQVL